MLLNTGARLQESLQVHPAAERMQSFPFPLSGLISAVKFSDDSQNKVKNTLVDIDLHQGYGVLKDVPITSSKANKIAGEEWTPDKGDVVVVQFLGGLWTKPVVTGFLFPQDNYIQAVKKDVPENTRKYHLRCNKTDLEIDKDGNRKTYIAGNEIIDVSGSTDITIFTGNYTIDINEGKLNISVSDDMEISVMGNTSIITVGNTEITTAGNAQINTSGDTEINSTGSIDITAIGECNVTAQKDMFVYAKQNLDISSGEKTTVGSMGVLALQSAEGLELAGKKGKTSGVVTKDCICPFTGQKHSDYSIEIKASKG